VDHQVDQLVSLESDGPNALANPWPVASPTPGFHEKDTVVHYQNKLVCSGAISLQETQIDVATNWLAVSHRLPKKDRYW
jgi:hypothetical protein